MQRVRLDNIDRRILRNLLSDGRHDECRAGPAGRHLGAALPAAGPRARRSGDHSWLSRRCRPEALGYAVTVFAQIGLASQADADLKAFESLVATWPEVREAYMLAGETDFLLKIVAPDWDSYQRFLSAKLTSAPNVSHVKSALMLRLSKSDPGVPIAEQPSRAVDGPLSTPTMTVSRRVSQKLL